MTRTTDLPAAKAVLSGLCGSPEPTAVLAAVSGGLDSMCLLHLLTIWGREQGIAVTAAHFNHQLRGAESDRDEAFVRDWCAAHAVPFVSGRGDVRALAAEKGLSIEEAAREARYAFLNEQKTALGCAFLLTAHHADDNAETLLLNLLRGTGLRGLCGIPRERAGLVRPFLQVTRAELAAYAVENGIPYVEDSTNAMDDAARNVLRHQVLPILKELNPRAVENMARTAALLADDAAALDAAAEALLSAAELVPDRSACLPLAALDGAPMAIRSRAVRTALAAVCGHEKDLTAAHVQAVLDLRRGQLSLPYGVTALREGDCLRLLKTAAPPLSQPISMGETVRFGPWRVTLTVDGVAEGISVSLPTDAVLTVTAWDPKDRLNGRTLKRLWADRGLTPAERDTLPVLRADGQVVAAALLNHEKAFAPDRHETAVRVIFLRVTEEKTDEQ